MDATGPSERTCIAFEGVRRIAFGPEAAIAPLVRAAAARGAEPVLVFDAETGEPVEIGPETAAAPPVPSSPAPVQRRPGRPKLGVVAREVTLLPRHWAWLSRQPGGASVALRKLVEEARRESAGAEHVRTAQTAAYRFMSAMAGDLPGFEEAVRAMYRADGARFAALIAGWPEDVRAHAASLAAPAFQGP